MTCQNNEILLNSVLIDLAKSFLQYVAESSPWVRTDASSLQEQVRVLAERQQQDVGEIVALLSDREHPIDFGSYPTEYTDLQFLSLERLISQLKSSQDHICRRLQDSAVSLRTAGDREAADIIDQVQGHESSIATALAEVAAELNKVSV